MVNSFKELAGKLPVGVRGDLTLHVDGLTIDVKGNKDTLEVYLPGGTELAKILKSLPDKDYLSHLMDQIFLFIEMYCIILDIRIQNGPSFTISKRTDPSVGLFLNAYPMFKTASQIAF